MAAPHFKMLWADDLPRAHLVDANGHAVDVVCIAGRLGHTSAPPPPPESWAAQADADVAILTLRMAPHAQWTLPAALGATTRRRLYFFRGGTLALGGQALAVGTMAEVRAGEDLTLVNGDAPAELLVLQGRPIGEPVAQYGPFVMNTQAEIQQAFADYRATQFGGWPWPRPDPVHTRDQGRFARHVDGTVETKA
jgi:redox-sensitive bicupin YhaK (pirin superfamily)